MGVDVKEGPVGSMVALGGGRRGLLREEARHTPRMGALCQILPLNWYAALLGFFRMNFGGTDAAFVDLHSAWGGISALVARSSQHSSFSSVSPS